jgi:hypothetical protein
VADENQVQQNNQGHGGNIDRLTRILGYDPSKGGSVSGAFTDALKEIEEERAKETKAKAKDFLVKAIDLRRKMAETERQFASQKKKFDKELGKLLNSIEALSRGQEPQVDSEQQENA